MEIKLIGGLEPEIAGIKVEGEITYLKEPRKVTGKDGDFYSQFIVIKDGDANEDSVGIGLNFGHEEDKLTEKNKGELVQVEKCRIHDYVGKDGKDKRSLRANRSNLSLMDGEPTAEKAEKTEAKKEPASVKNNGVWEQKDLKIVRMNCLTNATNLTTNMLQCKMFGDGATGQEKALAYLKTTAKQFEEDIYSGMHYPIKEQEGGDSPNEEPEVKTETETCETEDEPSAGNDHKPISGEQATTIRELQKQNHLSDELLGLILKQRYGKEELHDLSHADATDMVGYMIGYHARNGTKTGATK